MRIITSVSGGLGNQLFQYAFYQYLQVNFPNYDHYLDISSFEDYKRPYLLEEIFKINGRYVENEVIDKYKKNNLKERISNRLGMTKYVILPESRYNSNKIKESKNYLMTGYWQNFNMVDSIKDILNDNLVFRLKLNREECTLLESIKSNDSVSLHIRRGDYLNPENRKKFIGPCSDEYYDKAIEYFSGKYPKVVFFVFSDDDEYCRIKYGDKRNFYFVDRHLKDYYDLYFMSKCRHNIIANSSFSWWAAWFNENEQKEIVSPSSWFNYDDISKSILGEGWVKINRYGKQTDSPSNI